MYMHTYIRIYTHIMHAHKYIHIIPIFIFSFLKYIFKVTVNGQNAK